MTFTQLRILVAVARTGSMSRAAEESATSQSAVSHALRALERDLGAVLLVRGSRGVRLTAAGQAVYHRAVRILAELQALGQEAAAAGADEGGSLRVGTVPSANARLLPPILRRFRDTYPQVRLAVLEGSDAEVGDWLASGAADVAIVSAGTAHSLPGGAVARPLATDRLLAILPIGHRLTAGAAVPVSELARYPFIMSAGGCEPLITALTAAAGTTLNCHYRVRDTHSILAMVAEDLGVSIVPELALPTHPDGVYTAELRPPATRTVHLVLPAEPLSTAVAFAELAG